MWISTSRREYRVASVARGVACARHGVAVVNEIGAGASTGTVRDAPRCKNSGAASPRLGATIPPNSSC